MRWVMKSSRPRERSLSPHAGLRAALLVDLERAFGAVLLARVRLVGERGGYDGHAQHAVARLVLAEHIGPEDIAPAMAGALRLVEPQSHYVFQTSGRYITSRMPGE